MPPRPSLEASAAAVICGAGRGLTREGRRAPQTILRSTAFGQFEPEVKLAFQNAFGFPWDAGEDSPEEADKRRAFQPAIQAVRSEPTGPPRALELMKECYDLAYKLAVYVSPQDTLRDELMKIIATIAHVGEQIRRLPQVPSGPESDGNLQAASTPLVEVRDRWSRIEAWLRAEEQTAMPNPIAIEMERFRGIAAHTIEQVKGARAELAGLTLGGRNQIVASKRAEDLNRIGVSMDQICETLTAFSEKCRAPTAEEAAFYPYFERLADALGVQHEHEIVAGKLTRRSEVPTAALIVPRDLAERRRAVLQWICTRDPQVYALLPSAARRDHGAPAIEGGRGRRNLVLHGISAALVLLGLVDEAPTTGVPDGKALFAKTVKRVDRWIREEGRRGGFFVDPTPVPHIHPGGSISRRHFSVTVPLIARHSAGPPKG